jgi:hypothetical protein
VAQVPNQRLGSLAAIKEVERLIAQISQNLSDLKNSHNPNLQFNTETLASELRTKFAELNALNAKGQVDLEHADRIGVLTNQINDLTQKVFTLINKDKNHGILGDMRATDEAKPCPPIPLNTPKQAKFTKSPFASKTPPSPICSPCSPSVGL